MNKIDIKKKYAIVDDNRFYPTLITDKTFDTKEDAEEYKRDTYCVLEKTLEVAVLEGEVKPEACKAYPVAVTVIKYKDFDGNLWDSTEDCEISNACHILNDAISENVFVYKKSYCGCSNYYSISKKSGVFEFTITKQSQIDALWVIYKRNYENILKKKLLIKYDRCSGRGYCDELDKQMNRPKWINKLNNIQKIFDKTGSVQCKISHRSYIANYRGEEYDEFEEKLLVNLGKIGIEYVRKNMNDKTCLTCKFRNTDCGYICKNNNEPRCYVEVENDDVEKRPDVYADAFDVRDVYNWNEVDMYDFDV